MAERASVTTWTKIVPRRDTADPGVGLAARVADPLWLLARQFQFGEFTGDDGGAPTRIHVEATWTPFTRWHPGDPPTESGKGQPLDIAHQPLESLVEDDRGVSEIAAPPLLAVVEAGQRLARDLAAAGQGTAATALQTAFPVITGAGDGGDLFNGRAIDGFAVRAALAGGPAALPPEAAAAAAVLEAWRQWFDRRFGFRADSAAWMQERLEHRFGLAAPTPEGGELYVHAPEYLGQGIGWQDLDAVPLPPERALGAAGEAARIERVTVDAQFPQPLRWPGSPVDRFWELEDAAVDFGVVRLAPTDIAGLLAVDMMVTAGTDWFVVGVPLTIGGAARIDRIVVTDVFGDRTLIRLAERDLTGLGQLYTPRDPDDAPVPWLLLPPALLQRVDGPAIEEVLLVRDELANLGWAVELTAPLNDGEATDVASFLPPPPPPVRSAAAPADALGYLLTTGVPENWRPLVPLRRPEDGRRILRQGVIQGNEGKAAFTQLARQIVDLPDEEVPREGKLLRRFWQYGRWSDGSRHLWCGREVHPGRGEANSALRYDLAI